MSPDRVSNPGPLTYESGALPIALRGPAQKNVENENTVQPLYNSHQWDSIKVAVVGRGLLWRGKII